MNAPTDPRMQAITQDLSTKSDKIRALGRAGYSRREIADFLGIRYQHVRNVLVDEERLGKGAAVQTSAAAMTEREATTGAVRVSIGANGQVTLPKAMLDAIGTGSGKFVIVRLEDDEIHLTTPETTTRKIQSIVRKFVPDNVSLVDELIMERKREAERDEGDA